ncbi:MAG TPA: phage tail protein [Myxococcaceae bacterium]|nr:phage tail protein [Myxococcaceae bacterium]
MSNERREFLKALGVTAAAVAGTGCGVAAAGAAPAGGDAAAADATAAVAADEAALAPRSQATAKFGLELDGSFAGWVQSTEGGNAVADVVTEKVGADGFVKKHLAGVKYEDITINCGAGMSKAFYQWIQDTLTLKATRKNGAVIESDYNARELTRLEFSNALISEVDLPALDATSRATAKMTVKFSPEFIRSKKGNGVAIKFEIAADKWRTSDFKLKIDGLDDATSRALKIEAITIKQKVVENAVGEQRDYQKQPAGVDFSDVAVTVADSHAQSFYDWGQDFIVQGNNGDDKERGGTLDYLDSRLRPLFTLTFSHLGVFRVAPVNSNAAEKYRTIKAEMYCERIAFGASGGTD